MAETSFYREREAIVGFRQNSLDSFSCYNSRRGDHAFDAFLRKKNRRSTADLIGYFRDHGFAVLEIGRILVAHS